MGWVVLPERALTPVTLAFTPPLAAAAPPFA
jgi:hypothetical protein